MTRDENGATRPGATVSREFLKPVAALGFLVALVIALFPTSGPLGLDCGPPLTGALGYWAMSDVQTLRDSNDGDDREEADDLERLCRSRAEGRLFTGGAVAIAALIALGSASPRPRGGAGRSGASRVEDRPVYYEDRPGDLGTWLLDRGKKRRARKLDRDRDEWV